MNKTPQGKTLKRLSILSKLIEGLKLGETLPSLKFQSEILSTYGGKKPSRWDRVQKDLVEHYNARPFEERQCSLKIVADGILLNEGEPSRYKQRKEKAADEKEIIGQCLLSWLFDAPVDAMSFDEWKNSEGTKGRNFLKTDIPPFFRVNWGAHEAISNRLRRKRNIIRARTVVSILSDAGTSCEAFISKLLNANEFPLRTRIGDNDIRRISPSVVTNSLPIAQLLGDRTDVGLTLTGGRLSRERQSLVGEMALSWARWARERGTVDISIVGSTGITIGREGGYVAFMTDDLECELKAEFLQMASFRAIICDSSKLLMGSYTNRFANISKSDVDLVVIDDGFHIYDHGGFYSKTEVGTKLSDFSDAAADSGVGVITVSTPASQARKTSV